MITIENQIKVLHPNLVKLRRQFHRIPELGFKEFETSKAIADELAHLGVEFQTGIGGTGILARVEGKKPIPLILVRFDMDGLPIQEQNDMDYKSQNPGKMHACGHDCHIAVGLILTKLLKENRSNLEGSVEIFFQPAEENFGGAEALLKSGLLDTQKPDYALAFHVWNERPIGWVGISSGPVMAGDDIFSITITGRGGHGAIPNKSIDPILAGSQIILALQSIVSRNIDPLKPAVVSVTKFSAGETYNVIPEKAELLGTVRFFDEEIHSVLIRRITEICQAISRAMDCEVDLKIDSLTTPVMNDPLVIDILTNAILESSLKIHADSHFQTMGSEDMALILNQYPGAYLFVGSANPSKGKIAGHHHPQFDVDEDALSIAEELMFRSVIALMN